MNIEKDWPTLIEANHVREVKKKYNIKKKSSWVKINAGVNFNKTENSTETNNSEIHIQNNNSNAISKGIKRLYLNKCHLIKSFDFNNVDLYEYFEDSPTNNMRQRSFCRQIPIKHVASVLPDSRVNEMYCDFLNDYLPYVNFEQLGSTYIGSFNNYNNKLESVNKSENNEKKEISTEINESEIMCVRANVLSYYFSEMNLYNDKYLMSIMDEDGWVCLDTLLKFPRLLKTETTIQDVLYIIQKIKYPKFDSLNQTTISEAILELNNDENSCKIRRSDMTKFKANLLAFSKSGNYTPLQHELPYPKYTYNYFLNNLSNTYLCLTKDNKIETSSKNCDWTEVKPRVRRSRKSESCLNENQNNFNFDKQDNLDFEFSSEPNPMQQRNNPNLRRKQVSRKSIDRSRSRTISGGSEDELDESNIYILSMRPKMNYSKILDWADVSDSDEENEIPLPSNIQSKYVMSQRLLTKHPGGDRHPNPDYQPRSKIQEQLREIISDGLKDWKNNTEVIRRNRRDSSSSTSSDIKVQICQDEKAFKLMQKSLQNYDSLESNDEPKLPTSTIPIEQKVEVMKQKSVNVMVFKSLPEEGNMDFDFLLESSNSSLLSPVHYNSWNPPFTISNSLNILNDLWYGEAGINIAQKMKVHFESLWNFFDFGWGFYCLISFTVRLIATYQYQNLEHMYVNGTKLHSEDSVQMFSWGRNLIILGSAYWVIKSLELMQNWRLFGAYIEMIRIMIKQIAPPVLILSVIMTAFGVVRNGIMYQGVTDLSIGNILKNVYLKPYFMLYGEVYAPEIDPADFPPESKFTPLVWTVPIAMVLFMLSAVVVILSLIIAGVTDIYGKMKESSVKVYMYLRYPIIIDYESRPFAPPPFITLVWIYVILKKIYFSFKYCFCCIKKKIILNNEKNDHRDHSAGLKLFLSIDEIEKLHDFEEECVEDYWRHAKKSDEFETGNVIMRTLQCMDQTQFQISELHSRFNVMRINLQCTNNNLHDLNINYNNHNATFLKKIMEFEEKLNYHNTYLENKNCQVIQETYDENKYNLDDLQVLMNSDNPKKDNVFEKSFYKNNNFGSLSYRQNGMYKSNQPAYPLVDKYTIPLRRDYTTICDDIIISDWISNRETPSASPTNSMIDLSHPEKSKKSNRLMKSKAKRNKLLSNKEIVIGDKEEELRRAEKIEREEMTSVLVQRLRQLSHKQTYSSNDEIDENITEVVQEIVASKSEDTSSHKFSKPTISSSHINFGHAKGFTRQYSTPIAITDELVIFKLTSDLN